MADRVMEREAPPAPPAAGTEAPPRPRAGFVRRLLRDEPRVVVAGAFILLLVVLALGAPWIAPHDPLHQDLMTNTLPPAWLKGADPSFWLGTDSLGRDVLSRLIWGSRV